MPRESKILFHLAFSTRFRTEEISVASTICPYRTEKRTVPGLMNLSQATVNSALVVDMGSATCRSKEYKGEQNPWVKGSVPVLF